MVIAAATMALTAPSAGAVTGSADPSRFIVKVSAESGNCSGVLTAPQWILTSSACFPDTTAPGASTHPVTATVGSTDLGGTTGYRLAINAVVPQSGRPLVLARLATPVTDTAPITLAATPVQAGETLQVAGYGRTATEWVPNQPHVTTVTAGTPATTTFPATSATGPTTCRGDAGGPAYRTTGSGPELVGLNHSSWQNGCLGETETRTGATEIRVDDLHDTLTTQMNSPILTRYLGLGGANSFLGSPVGNEYTVAGGSGQDYQHGAIYYSAATGAHIVQDDILTKYKAIGGPTAIGFPLTDQNTTPDGVGRYNHFSLGGGASIYWTPATNAHVVQGSIHEKWAALGWERGLGYPVTDEVTITGITGESGRYTDFSHPDTASIYWSPASGTHEIQGDIRKKWLSLGGAPKLGFPTTDESTTPDGVGRYNHFNHPDGLSVYWSSASGAHHIQGAIRNKWADYGWETGFGYPTTDETVTSDGVGRYNHFTNNASVYWTPATAAHAVFGSIRETWAGLGWENSRLAYPTSDEYDVTGGRRNDFQHGNITWTSANNTTQVTYF
ncbi:trypsin-like serine protease [Amycolatopsis dongchuanensis]|uniref:trypsin-like serine protease n=1 Tax=Amycolatopsis dongchuanensis TaxID=1070866 RepID=UPI0031F7B15A